MDKLIEKAKRLAEEWYGCSAGKRQWLEAEPPHSYGDPSYRVRLFVLEGSPPKGYILADYSYRLVKVFSANFLKTETLRLKDEEI